MLRKIFCLSLLVITTCSCNNTKPVSPIFNNITFNAKIVYKDENFLCKGTLQNNVLKLNVIEPESIKNLILIVDKDKITVEFNEIKHSFNINNLPKSAVFKILYNVIINASSKKSTPSSAENCIIQETINDICYTLIFSPSGLPISLNVEKIDLYIQFFNVSIKV